MNKVELFNDHFQNFKVYGIPKAQLIIADPPYNLGKNAYASNPSWYVDGDNKNGESDKAGKEFFDTDKDFRPAEFMHFCSQMLVKEPKESGKAPCMIVFCEFEQQFKYIELGKQYGFNHYINLVFRKNFRHKSPCHCCNTLSAYSPTPAMLSLTRAPEAVQRFSLQRNLGGAHTDLKSKRTFSRRHKKRF